MENSMIPTSKTAMRPRRLGCGRPTRRDAAQAHPCFCLRAPPLRSIRRIDSENTTSGAVANHDDGLVGRTRCEQQRLAKACRHVNFKHSTT